MSAAPGTPLPLRPSAQPRLEPVTPAQARAYAAAQHPSIDAVIANVMAERALATLGPTLGASRASAPGAGVSGYRFLSAALGPDLAATIPGTLTAEGQHPSASGWGVARDVALLSPWLRGGRSIARAAGAVAHGAPLATVIEASRVRQPFVGPAIRTAFRTAQPRVDQQGQLQSLAGTNYTPAHHSLAAVYTELVSRQLALAEQRRQARAAAQTPTGPQPAAGLVGAASPFTTLAGVQR